ncbi:MAG TPA: galactokinase family protein [Blastocatellia bacterium]|nr:galactokinase family protein [Blastocatellia bacterium]
MNADAIKNDKDDAARASRGARLDELRRRFCERYGGGPVSVCRAPARINILGEHVDYVAYLPTASLPFASREHGMLMLYRAAADLRVRGASTHEAYTPFAFDLGDAPPLAIPVEQAWLDYLINSEIPAPHWSNYVKGAAYFARLKHGERIQRGVDFMVDSNIPPSGGASSSSALTVLAGAALLEVNHVRFRPDELARDSARAEWFLGTRGGAMDHMTICLARRHRAVHIAYTDHGYELAPLPGDGFRWVTFFTHPADKGREVMLEYNERAAVSRLLIPSVIEDWRRDRPALADAWAGAVKRVGDATLAALDELERLLAELPAQTTLAEVARRSAATFAACERAFPALVRTRREQPLKLRERARHHVTETRRVAEAVRLLRATFGEDAINESGSSDEAVRYLGTLINASHDSLRDGYEVSTPEVEALMSILRADADVYGARLMGGGFGGNVLALTAASNVTRLIERVQSEFYAPRRRDGLSEGAVMVSTAGDGLCGE